MHIEGVSIGMSAVYAENAFGETLPADILRSSVGAGADQDLLPQERHPPSTLGVIDRDAAGVGGSHLEKMRQEMRKRESPIKEKRCKSTSAPLT